MKSEFSTFCRPGIKGESTMDEAGRNEIFLAHSQNVHQLEASWVQLRRVINEALRRNDTAAVNALTKVGAITFCALSESVLLKLVHTPEGFTLAEIQQLQQARMKNSIAEAWKKCIHLALRYVDGTKSGFIPNTKQKFNGLVEQYIVKPSQLRNKIAHGQWKIAINRSGTSVNSELTTSLEALDFLLLESWYIALKRIAEIVEWMIESPRKAFPANYWRVVDRLDNELDRRQGWTMESKRQQLIRKSPPR